MKFFNNDMVFDVEHQKRYNRLDADNND